LCVIFYFCFLGPTSNTLRPTQIKQYESEHGELLKIGQLVADYKSKHQGRPPQQLRDLASYDTYNEAWLNGYDLPLSSNNSHVLAFEKPGLWQDGTIAVCFDDLTVKRLKRAKFDALSK
jgi:hypothetical protein